MKSSTQIRVHVLKFVHAFYLGIIEQKLMYPVPLPDGLDASVAGGESSAPLLLRWLGVLDMAISPPTLRDALSNLDDRRVAEALLQYFVYKPAHSDSDRDKTDFVVTWLYRHPPTANGWEIRGAFAQAVVAILELQELPPMAEQYGQLLREFSFLRDHVLELEDFDSLMDSGLIGRVRDLKASFGETFYNPAVLARVAEYNSLFGKCFDELFHQATRQIKSFAEGVQQQGSAVLTTTDEISTKDFQEVEDEQILQQDYRTAQDRFRTVSRLQKAVEQQSHSRAIARSQSVGRPTESGSGFRSHDERVTSGKEEEKLGTMVETIRSFVRGADPPFGMVVPMKHGNFNLQPFEADAFRSEYRGEKSFRAELATFLMRSAAISARIEAETFEYRLHESSGYSWKPHADGLAYLVRVAQQLGAQARAISSIAEKRGLLDKVEAINRSLLRLSQLVRSTAELLSRIGSES